MKPASRFVLTLRYGAALALFLVTAAGGATSGARAQGQVKGINEIIRSLAPIKGPLRTSNTQARQSIDLDIRFAVNKARPLPSARPQLRALGLALSAPELQHIAVEIAGHTDATGRAVYNKALSLRRARAVSAYLQQKFRIDPSRLAVAGYGEEQLKDPANSAGAVNRRVEIAVISPAASTTSTAPDASTATLKTSRAGNDDTESGTWGDLLRNRDGAQTFMAQAEANGQVRVIVALSAPKTNAAQAQGWRNLNDYIRDIQNQALTTLGWTNINDLVRYDYTPAMAMSVTPARLRQLLQGEAVAQVFVDQMLSPSLLQSVPHIGLPMPRATSRSGAGQAVAVLDTGVDGRHPFLRGKVTAEACFSTTGSRRRAVFRSACPSGLDSEVGPGAGRPCDPAYGCSHGTHVAGIVAGANGEMSGVASQASIVAVQVFTLADAPDCGKCVTALMSDVLHGLEWVYRNRDRYNIAAVNLSPGGGRFRGYCDGDAPYTRIINLLAQANIATVVASGNDGFAHAMAQPACVEDAIAVGATSMRDHVAPFSNSTGYLDFLAPGHTESNDPKNRGILSAVPGTGFQRQSGTSLAAPHLAGAYAILKGAVPEATLWQMTDVLRRTGRLIQDPRNGVRTPRIQLNVAIAALRLAVARAQPKPQPRPSRYRHRHRKIGWKNDPKSMTASASKTAGMTARARAARTRLSGRDEQFELKKPPGTAISLAMDRASYEDTM